MINKHNNKHNLLLINKLHTVRTRSDVCDSSQACRNFSGSLIQSFSQPILFCPPCSVDYNVDNKNRAGCFYIIAGGPGNWEIIFNFHVLRQPVSNRRCAASPPPVLIKWRCRSLEVWRKVGGINGMKVLEVLEVSTDNVPIM